MHIPKDWRLKQQRYQLQATQYADGGINFPPRPTVRQRIVERYNLKMKDEWSQPNSHAWKRKTALAEIFLTK